MLIQDMSDKECRALLARTGFGRLACARDNRPYVVPIYFAYEPDRLYGFTTVGQKIEWMRANPIVCLEADDVTSHFQWESVIVFGRYEEFPDTPEYASERKQAQEQLEKRYLWWQTAYAANRLRKEDKPASPLFYCIHIESMTGHRAVPDRVESSYKFPTERTPG